MKTKIDKPTGGFVAGGNWFRFSSYESVPTQGGYGRHVRPEKRAKIELYRPFDHPREILLEYLTLGRLLSEDQLICKEEAEDEKVPSDAEAWRLLLAREDKRAQWILSFAKKYGLPGTLWQCNPKIDSRWDQDQSTRKFRKDDSHVFVPNSRWANSLSSLTVSATGRMDCSKFLGLFLADQWSISDALKFNKSFLKAYAEPVRSIEDDAADLYRIATEWHRFREGGHSPADSYVTPDGSAIPTTWQRQLKKDTATGNIGVGVSWDANTREVRLDHTFQSLIAALRIMFVLNVTSPATGQVRLCALPECGKPFKARYERSRFCCGSHSNTARQRALLKRDPNYYRKLANP